MAERRKFIRINVISDVDIVPLNDPNSAPVKGVIANISASGIGTITNGNFAVDTKVYLTFRLQGGPEFKNIKGEVVRVETIAEKHFIFIGVDLGGFSQEQKNVLNRYVMELRHKYYSAKLGI